MTKEIINLATSYSKAGFTIIKVRGKKPIADKWTTEADYVMPSEVEGFLSNWGGNFGVVLSEEDLVVDVDPRHFPKGDNPLERLLSEMKTDLKVLRARTAIVKTGGGGAHLYFTIPAEINVEENIKKWKGLEFKSKGRQVVGAGCIHPDTKLPYKLLGNLNAIIPAPQALLEIISTPDPQKANKREIKDCMDGNPTVLLKYQRYLEEVEPAIEGESGDATTFRVCCKGRDLSLSPEKTAEMVTIFFNPRCVPPWSAKELMEKVRNAYEYAKGKQGQGLPQSDFDEIPMEDEENWVTWHFVKKGSNILKTNINNIVNFFIVSGSPFEKALIFDDFKKQIKIQKKLPWHKDKNISPEKLAVWNDYESVNMRLWLSKEKRFDMSRELIGQGALAAALKNEVHPLRDWLLSIKWDGKPRIERWLLEVAGAVGHEGLIRALSKVTLLQAVARVLDPGHQVDSVLVLEGPQGIGKSKLVQALGGEFYSNFNLDPKNKDTFLSMFGKWIIEMSEMDVTRKVDANTLKTFITTRVDNLRLPYATEAQDYPRQCIFIGTVNKDAMGEYLYDTTGNRRFFPVEIRLVNDALLRNIREQLFAEAVFRFQKGEPTYIRDNKLLEVAKREQKMRQATDPWDNTIASYVREEQPWFLSTSYVWRFILKGDEIKLKRNDQRRIADILRDLGYVHKHTRVNNKPTRGFVHDGYKLLDKADKARKRRNN